MNLSEDDNSRPSQPVDEPVRNALARSSPKYKEVTNQFSKADTLHMHVQNSQESENAHIEKMKTGHNFIDILRNLSLAKKRKHTMPQVLV